MVKFYKTRNSKSHMYIQETRIAFSSFQGASSSKLIQKVTDFMYLRQKIEFKMSPTFKKVQKTISVLKQRSHSASLT